MSKWQAVILIVAAIAGHGQAQDNEQVHALVRRVKLDPERRDFADSLDDFDEAAILRLAGYVFLPSLPQATSGLHVATSIIQDRVANDRYDNALAEYRR